MSIPRISQESHFLKSKDKSQLRCIPDMWQHSINKCSWRHTVTSFIYKVWNSSLSRSWEFVSIKKKAIFLVFYKIKKILRKINVHRPHTTCSFMYSLKFMFLLTLKSTSSNAQKSHYISQPTNQLTNQSITTVWCIRASAVQSKNDSNTERQYK